MLVQAIYTKAILLAKLVIYIRAMKITTTCNKMEKNLTSIVFYERNLNRKNIYCVSPFI